MDGVCLCGEPAFVVFSARPGQPLFDVRKGFALAPGSRGENVPWGRLVGKVNGMSQEHKSFTVSDRRHFTSEGERRADPETAPDPVSQEAEGNTARPGRASNEPVVAEFGPFVLSLAAQAGYILAAEGDEAKGALDEARYLISVLEMLKDRTEGRRSAEEDRLLEGLLYELRIAWVSRSRAGVA